MNMLCQMIWCEISSFLSVMIIQCWSDVTSSIIVIYSGIAHQQLVALDSCVHNASKFVSWSTIDELWRNQGQLVGKCARSLPEKFPATSLLFLQINLLLRTTKIFTSCSVTSFSRFTMTLAKTGARRWYYFVSERSCCDNQHSKILKISWAIIRW